MSEPTSGSHASDNTKQSKWTWLIPVGLLALLIGLYFLWPGFQKFVDEAYRVLSIGEQQQVEQWVDGFGFWRFAVIFALMLMQVVLAFLPSVIVMVVCVVAFGPVLGGLLAWIGMLVAASFGYGIGYWLSDVAFSRLIGAFTERKMEHFVDRYGVWAVVAARISPVLSTDAVSITAGLVQMRFLKFALATGVGTIPLTILIAWLGSDINLLKSGLIWISVVSMAVFVGYVLYDHKKQRAGT